MVAQYEPRMASIRGIRRPFAQVVAVMMMTLTLLTITILPGLAQPTTAVDVRIINPDGVLVSEDESFIREQVEGMDLPEAISHLVFYVIDRNSGNLDKDVQDYGQQVDTSILRDDRNRFEHHTLILAVGLDPRRAGIYCGDAVCQALDLFEGAHLDAAIEAMKPGFSRGNYPIGLLGGLTTAIDPSQVAYAPNQAQGGQDVGDSFRDFLDDLMLVAIVSFVGGSVFLLWVRYRAFKTAFKHLQQSLSDQAFDLDEVNIRANSLSSPLAHATLRQEWETVLNAFVSVNNTIEMVRGWNRDPGMRQLLKHGRAIEEADREVTRLNTAVKNINDLFALEQGDANVRLKTIVDLENDIIEAISRSSSTLSRDDLRVVQARVKELESKIHSPDFMTDYVRVLGAYQNTLEGVTQREYGETIAASQTSRPAIYDTNWQMGTGTNNWVPFLVWSQLAANSSNSWESASSSSWDSDSFGAGSSGFSGGFSGGGGSSSW